MQIETDNSIYSIDSMTNLCSGGRVTPFDRCARISSILQIRFQKGNRRKLFCQIKCKSQVNCVNLPPTVHQNLNYTCVSKTKSKALQQTDAIIIWLLHGFSLQLIQKLDLVCTLQDADKPRQQDRVKIETNDYK